MKSIVILAVAAWSTCTMAMGASWIKGDCEMVFKVFGGVLFLVGLGILAANAIHALAPSE